MKNWESVGSVELGLAHTAHGAETLLKLVDASFGIDELLLSREERVGSGSDADRDDAVFHTIDLFLLFGSLGRAGDETRTGGHVNEDDRIVLRMNFLFHETL